VKVLIATDGSKDAISGVQTANRLLSRMNREVDLLCVGPRLPKKAKAATTPDRVQRYEQRLLGQITQILKRASANLEACAGAVQLLPELGSPSAAIVKKSGNYDLVVVGPKGRRTAGEVGLGPVASRVLEHANAPVLIARELRTEDAIRVLIAVDGSTASLRAAETLGELFDLTGAEVCLMHVAETPWVELGLEADWVTYSEEDKEQSEAGKMEHELVREGEEVLEEARDVLRPFGVSVSTRLDEGNPANEILSEAERGQYDLVVVGGTGVRDLKHRMLGSVSSKIAWNAPCSVLVVHEAE